MLINTLDDLWNKHFTAYPMGIEYSIEDENIVEWISDVDEMQKFFDKYRDYEVIDFCINCHLKDSVYLDLIIKKEEFEDG